MTVLEAESVGAWNELAESAGRSGRRRAHTGAMRAQLADTPWSVGDVPRTGSRLLLGAVGIGVSYLGVSGTASWRQQLLWVAVGVVATTVAVLGVVLWLLSGLVSIRTQRTEVRRLLERRHALVELARQPARQSPSGDERWVTGPGMTRMHRPSCSLTVGKSVVPVTKRRQASGSLTVCGICGR